MGAAATRTLTLGRKSAVKLLNCSQAVIIQLAGLAVLRAGCTRPESPITSRSFSSLEEPGGPAGIVRRPGTDHLTETDATMWLHAPRQAEPTF